MTQQQKNTISNLLKLKNSLLECRQKRAIANLIDRYVFNSNVSDDSKNFTEAQRDQASRFLADCQAEAELWLV